LIDCYCPDSHDTFHTFAQDFVASAIQLTGVELYGLRFKNIINYHLSQNGGLDVEEVRERRRRNDGLDMGEFRELRRAETVYDYDSLAMRPNTKCWDTETLRARGRMAKMDLVSGWPYERTELEAAMLGGRGNNIARRINTAPACSARSWWYDVPVSYA